MAFPVSHGEKRNKQFGGRVCITYDTFYIYLISTQVVRSTYDTFIKYIKMHPIDT